MKYGIKPIATIFFILSNLSLYAPQSMEVGGYYGVMGGEPPQSYGSFKAGAYSFSMGFRRLPN